jgi:hypothetical protein
MGIILNYRGNTHNSDGQEVVDSYHHRKAKDERRYTHRHGRALRMMLEGWEMYAEASLKEFDAPIGEDGCIGVYWKDIGRSLFRLMDGITGGWDASSISGNIHQIMMDNKAGDLYE